MRYGRGENKTVFFLIRECAIIRHNAKRLAEPQNSLLKRFIFNRAFWRMYVRQRDFKRLHGFLSFIDKWRFLLVSY